MRICLVYDCLFPHTVGGAERWYRNLAERLVREGHEVTYLTLRQWPRGTDPGVPGVAVRAVGPRMRLYARSGRRRVLPPLVFGAGVLAHLLVRGGRFDVVHTASFPYFSVLGVATARAVRGFRMIVDWHEVWSPVYWREYLGPAGRAGWAIQRLCARLPQQAFCFSRMHQRRLRELGLDGVRLLEGEYAGPLDRPEPAVADPVVVFAGRHIPEKRVPSLIPAIGLARRRFPELRCSIYGDGPERVVVERLVASHGLSDVVAVHGFVPADEVQRGLRTALCMALPSRREGYGLVVVEAAASGVPSVVVADQDNAATELVEEGVNGAIALSAEPAEIADAIVRIAELGRDLRESTADWFERNGPRLSLESSLSVLLATYADAT